MKVACEKPDMLPVDPCPWDIWTSFGGSGTPIIVIK